MSTKSLYGIPNEGRCQFNIRGILTMTKSAVFLKKSVAGNLLFYAEFSICGRLI